MEIATARVFKAGHSFKDADDSIKSTKEYNAGNDTTAPQDALTFHSAQQNDRICSSLTAKLQ